MGNIALPGGFVDTGVTGSTSASISAQCRGFGFSGAYGEGCDFDALDHTYYAYHTYDPPGSVPPPNQPRIVGLFYLRGPCNRNGFDANGNPIPIATVAGPPGSGEAAAPPGPEVSFQRTMGPFRLGMRWRLKDGVGPGPETPPYFCQKHYVVEYSWFADYDTWINWACSHGNPGSAAMRYLQRAYMGMPMGAPITADITPVNAGPTIGGAAFGARVPYQSGWYDWDWAVRILGCAVDGVSVDYTGIKPENSNQVMKNIGGVLACKDWGVRGPYGNDDHSYRAAHSVGAAFHWGYDIDVEAWGESGGFPVSPRVLDGWLTNLQLDADGNPLQPYHEDLPVPFTGEWSALSSKSWPDGRKRFGGVVSFVLKSPDPLKEILELPEEVPDPARPEDPNARIPNPKLYEDLNLPILISPPRQGIGSGGYYEPVTLSIVEQIELNRPDGNRPSNWTSAVAACSVTELSDRSQFVISSGGSPGSYEVARTLRTNWRNYIDKSGGSVDAPDFSMEGYTVLKHNHKGPTQLVYPEDVWWWGTYRYLKLDLEAPVGGALSFEVDFVTVDVFDDHKTGLDRKLDLEVIQTPGRFTWTLPVQAGRHTYEIDLLFPDEGGPQYLGRVEKLTLGGLRPPLNGSHTYTLHGVQLFVKRRDGQARSTIKLGFGIPKHRRDYSAPVISVQGSWTMGNWPDQAVKPEEVGGHGGSLRYWEPLTGRTTGTNLDYGYSVEAFWARLRLLEGLSVEYSHAEEEAANRDEAVNGRLVSSGMPGSPQQPEVTGPNSLGGLTAQCTWEIAPYAEFGTDLTYRPKVSPVCATVYLASSVPFTIQARMHLWGAVEAVVGGEKGAARAGVTLQLHRRDTGDPVAIATTDEDGYLVFHPVRANGEIQYGIGP